jgi:hypothetical protein
MRISIPLDLSSRSFIPPPCFSKRRMKGSFLRGLSTSLTLHSFSVTLFALGSLFFLIQLQINTQEVSALIIKSQVGNILAKAEELRINFSF